MVANCHITINQATEENKLMYDLWKVSFHKIKKPKQITEKPNKRCTAMKLNRNNKLSCYFINITLIHPAENKSLVCE